MNTSHPKLMKPKMVLMLLLSMFSALGLRAQTVNLATLPEAITLAPNEESSFFVLLDNPDNSSIDGVQLYMDFDASSIEVLEFEEVFNWAFTLSQSIDGSNGRLTFAAGNLQNAPNSDLTILKIKVRVRSDATPNTSQFSFDRNSPRKCEVASGGFDLLDQSTDLTINIIEDCPNIRTIDHSPIIDGLFTAGNTIILADNLSIFNSAQLNAQQSTIPQSLQMTAGTELRVTDDNCTPSNL